jgi:hypothetical protein
MSFNVNIFTIRNQRHSPLVVTSQSRRRVETTGSVLDGAAPVLD